MLEKILEKWDAILLNIKEEHDVTDVSYKTWLLPLKPYSVDKNILTILVPDALLLEYVKSHLSPKTASKRRNRKKS